MSKESESLPAKKTDQVDANLQAVLPVFAAAITFPGKSVNSPDNPTQLLLQPPTWIRALEYYFNSLTGGAITESEEFVFDVICDEGPIIQEQFPMINDLDEFITQCVFAAMHFDSNNF